MREDKKSYEIVIRILKGRTPAEDLGLNYRIMFKFILT
jgi:hypothetical protein